MKFLLATKNEHKIREMNRILEPLGILVIGEKDCGVALPEVEETGTTFAENARLKAGGLGAHLLCDVAHLRVHIVEQTGKV